MWVYLAELRDSDRPSGHYNHFYDASKFQGPLLPPAAALAPTLWPQFHLRWACPSESQGGELETHCRNMAEKLSELQKVRNLFLFIIVHLIFLSFCCVVSVPVGPEKILSSLKSLCCMYAQIIVREFAKSTSLDRVWNNGCMVDSVSYVGI